MRDYFVIFYDEHSNRLEVDDDEAVKRFPNGLMRDLVDGSWIDQGDFGELDATASKAVRSALDLYNDVLKDITPESPS